MVLVVFTSVQLISLFLIFLCIGYTLLTYSLDGDISIRTKQNIHYFKESTLDEAWNRLEVLTTLNDVNWNKSLFIAFVSSIGICSLFSKKYKYNKGIYIFIPSMLIIFAMCDIINRWNQAHRKDLINYECSGIIKRLRPQFIY